MSGAADASAVAWNDQAGLVGDNDRLLPTVASTASTDPGGSPSARAQGTLGHVMSRWLIVLPALVAATVMCGCAGGDEGSSAGLATASPGTVATSATAVPSESASSTSTDAAGQQMCDSLKAIEAAGGATPADLAAAGEVGAKSSNPDISRQAQLLAAYAAAAALGNQAGDLSGMVQDLLAACRENGYI